MRKLSVVLVVLLVALSVVAPAAAAGSGDGTAASVSTADDCEFPVTVTDNTDTDVTVEEEPETVVTLNPSAAQTMWEIGADEKVIGVTRHAENLDGAEDRTNVSVPGETIDAETVVDLEPDLVLAPNVVSEEKVEQLRDTGLTVYHFKQEESIEDVYDKTHTIGQLVGECAGAEETVEWMQSELDIVESTVEGEERPDVLYTFFGFTAGNNTFINEIIQSAGGENIAVEADIEGYQQISDEVVIDEDPDWIVLNTNSPELPDSEAYNATTAVEEGQVVTIEVNHLNRPAPRIVHAITELAETFHPDAYAEARAEAEATPTPTAEPTETPTPEPTAEPTATTAGSSADEDAESAPGLGALTALAALLFATMAAYRRDNSGG